MFQILVIDDDPIVRMVLKNALKEQEYQVTFAKRGDEGLAQAQQLRPALIICDWLMPGLDGLEVCRCVKADPTLTTAFFILLTSRSAIEDRVRGLDSGADDFLSKPIEINELKARVRSGLRLYQSSQELQRLAQDLQQQKQILETELAEAAAYVQSLLPDRLNGAIATDSRFIPSRQLGGDCFDYFWLNSSHFALYLLDVSGHGLGAALPSVSVQNLLRSQSLQSVDFEEPAAVLQALNKIFQMTTHHDRYFTIWYGVYNCQTRELKYASAGHPPAILISKDATELQHLKTKGTPIGMFLDRQYQTERCHLAEASTLYLFSDGIYEIKKSDGSLLGLQDCAQMLRSHHNFNRENLTAILQTIQSLQKSEIFEDDCSLLQVKFQ
ncbi:MAG TPA: SpoIIE family protein phosphatase [Trichocoleus sp.]|jgi:sigma-B regulation protein RsbU (phosphoserine phosphatase)